VTSVIHSYESCLKNNENFVFCILLSVVCSCARSERFLFRAASIFPVGLDFWSTCWSHFALTLAAGKNLRVAGSQARPSFLIRESRQVTYFLAQVFGFEFNRPAPVQIFFVKANPALPVHVWPWWICSAAPDFSSSSIFLRAWSLCSVS
jgi:hypothetical protein